jgi:biopolymer transport protein ExbB/TolQ
MARGLGGLATVAATAPWLGLLLTLSGYRFHTFLPCGGEKSRCMAAIADGLSMHLWPAALALGLATLATWGYRHLRAQIDFFDVEMQNAAQALPWLIAAGLRHRGWPIADRGILSA